MEKWNINEGADRGKGRIEGGKCNVTAHGVWTTWSEGNVMTTWSEGNLTQHMEYEGNVMTQHMECGQLGVREM